MRGGKWALLAACALGACGVSSVNARQGPAAAGAVAGDVHGLTVTPAPAAPSALGHSLIPGPRGRAEGNAAPLYYQAMLEMATLPADDQQALDEMGRAEPANIDMIHGMSIVDRLRHPFELIDLATQRDGCDWATPLRERGVGVVVPEAGHLRLLGIALAAKARLEIFRGEREQGLKTIGIGLAVARHAARGPTILQAVVGMFIADRMADQIEAYMETDSAPSLYWALVELGDHPVDIERGARAERFMLNYEVPSLAEIESGKMAPEDAVREMSPWLYPELSRTPGGKPGGWAMAVAAAAGYPAARAALIARGVPPAQVERWPVAYVTMRYHLERYEELRDELYKWLPLPWWESRRGLEEAQQKIEDAKARGEGGALPQMIPNIAGLARNAATLERRFAMLRTVEALRLYAGSNRGEAPSTLDALRGTPLPLDPATGRAFSYRVEAGPGGVQRVVLGGMAGAKPASGAPERMEYRMTFIPARGK